MNDERVEVHVTPKTCAGTGICTFYAGNTFELDQEGKVSIASRRGDSPEDVRNAAEACPTRSIVLTCSP